MFIQSSRHGMSQELWHRAMHPLHPYILPSKQICQAKIPWNGNGEMVIRKRSDKESYKWVNCRGSRVVQSKSLPSAYKGKVTTNLHYLKDHRIDNA